MKWEEQIPENMCIQFFNRRETVLQQQLATRAHGFADSRAVSSFIRPEKRKTDKQGGDEVLQKMMNPSSLFLFWCPGTTYSLLFFRRKKGKVGDLVLYFKWCKYI